MGRNRLVALGQWKPRKNVFFFNFIFLRPKYITSSAVCRESVRLKVSPSVVGMSAVLTYQLPSCLWVSRKHGKKNKRADVNLLSADYPDSTLLRIRAPAFNPLHRVAVRVDDRSALFCWFGEISVINTYRTKSSLRKPILKTKSYLAHMVFNRKPPRRRGFSRHIGSRQRRDRCSPSHTRPPGSAQNQ